MKNFLTKNRWYLQVFGLPFIQDYTVDAYKEVTNSLRNSKKRDLIQIELYKRAKHDASKLITRKKQEFFKAKLSETISKPKELWESLKSLGMPNKTLISSFNAIEQENSLTHGICSISKIFKNFFSNLAESLLIKLLNPPDKYNLKSVIQYYSSFAITTLLLSGWHY